MNAGAAVTAVKEAGVRNAGRWPRSQVTRPLRCDAAEVLFLGKVLNGLNGFKQWRDESGLFYIAL